MKNKMEMRKDDFIQTEILIDTNGCIWYKQLKHDYEIFCQLTYDRIYVLYNITKYVDRANGGILLNMEQLTYKTMEIKGKKDDLVEGFTPYTKLQAQIEQVLVVTEVEN